MMRRQSQAGRTWELDGSVERPHPVRMRGGLSGNVIRGVFRRFGMRISGGRGVNGRVDREQTRTVWF